MSEQNPLVSIVVTCYNYGRYIVPCLDSIFSQTFQDFEIVVINDGSTDNSEELIRSFLEDSKLKYIYQKNSGQANAKNNGIKNSAGKYIAFLDADDLWDKTKLEKQIPLFSRDNIGVVYSKAKFVDEHGQFLDFILKDKYLTPRSGEVTNHLFFNNFVPFSSSVVRKECFEKLGCFDESFEMGIDWDLWLRISIQYDFDYIDEPLLIYRLGHPGQMSKNAEKRHHCSDNIMDKFIKQFPSHISPALFAQIQAYTYCNRAYYFSGKNLAKSNRYYLMAMKQSPFKLSAYKGMLNNFVKFLLRQMKQKRN